MAHPPHHPPPHPAHHPPPHPHHPPPHHFNLVEFEGGDDFVPMAHPPHHPPPHPAHHPHPHPHHPHPHHFDLTAVEEPPVSCCEPDGYGELARTAVDDLAKALGLDETPTPVFYDLGSGAGKVVAHMALAGYAAKAVGVEVNDGRHVAALALRAAALASKGADVDLRNEDMFDVDLAEATALYVNQACFPAEVRDRLQAKILREAANLEYVVAAPPIPALEAAGRFVVDQPVLHLPMELYTYATPLTIYRRADRTA